MGISNEWAVKALKIKQWLNMVDKNPLLRGEIPKNFQEFVIYAESFQVVR